MVIFHSYVKLPEGNHRGSSLDVYWQNQLLVQSKVGLHLRMSWGMGQVTWLILP